MCDMATIHPDGISNPCGVTRDHGAHSRKVLSPCDCENYDSCNDSRFKSRLTPSSPVRTLQAAVMHQHGLTVQARLEI
jgi:hypothetical protein